MTLLEELRKVVDELDASGVSYALVGGLAVAVWGAPRATRDIDLLVRREQLDEAMAAAKRCGYALPAAPMVFRDGMTVQRVSRVEGGELLTIDYLIVNAQLEDIWISRQELASSEGRLWVVSRDALIQMKVAAGRPQDAADVEKLMDLDR